MMRNTYYKEFSLFRTLITKDLTGDGVLVFDKKGNPMGHIRTGKKWTT